MSKNDNDEWGMMLVVLVWIVFFFLLSFSQGCAGPPRRLVVQDHEGFSTSVIDAVDEFEGLIGCRLWSEIDIGGSRRDWSGLFPPRGTATMEFNREYVGANRLGTTIHGLRHGRNRVFFKWERPYSPIVVHELLHILMRGRNHDSSGIMMKKPNTFDLERLLEETPTATMQKIKSFCLGD